MMLKWKDEELRTLISPKSTLEDWKKLNSKQIGVKLEKWFESLDNEELEECDNLNSRSPRFQRWGSIEVEEFLAG